MQKAISVEFFCTNIIGSLLKSVKQAIECFLKTLQKLNENPEYY